MNTDETSLDKEGLIELFEQKIPEKTTSFRQLLKLIKEKNDKPSTSTPLEIDVELFISNLVQQGVTANRYPALNRDQVKAFFSEEVISYIKSRIVKTENCFLKAKYSDVLFELNKRNIDYGEIAIECYLDCARVQFVEKRYFLLLDPLKRSLALSLFLKKNHLITVSVELHLEIFRSISNFNNGTVLSRILDSLVSFHKIIGNQVDFIELESSIEKIIEQSDIPAQSTYNIERMLLTSLYRLPHLKSNNNKRKNILYRIGKSYEKEGDYVLGVRSPTVAGIFYDDAIKKYHEAGINQSIIDDLKKKTRNINLNAVKNEFYKVRTETSVDISEIENRLKQYSGKPITEMIRILGYDQKDFPSFQKIKKEVSEESHPFMLFRKFALKDGIKVKNIASVEDDIRYKAVIEHRMKAIIMNKAIHSEIFKNMEKLDPEYVDLIKSDIFNSQLVDENCSKLLGEGFRMFQEESFIGSMHILVFQIEAILRQIIKKAGEETFIYKNGESKDLPLGSITRIILEKGLLNSDLVKHIEVMLNDAIGWNLRNEIAHGRMRFEAYSKENNQLLITILLKIVKEYEKNSTEQ